MTDVFEVLMADHREVERMLVTLTDHSSAAELRAKTAEQLVIEESRHEAAEEMHFWPAVREKVNGGDELADTALSQEAEGKKLLDELRRTDEDKPRFSELVREFATAGRNHIAFEEEQVWPGLQTVLSDEERVQLGQDIQAAKEKGPTRPHPHGPDNPAGLKTAGAATAAVDKARDAMTGRGQ
jgi:hemerythrin-like domain-containing protein